MAPCSLFVAPVGVGRGRVTRRLPGDSRGASLSGTRQRPSWAVLAPMSRRRSLCGWRMQAADDSGDGNRETSEPAEGEAWVIRASPREQAETAEAETSGEGAAAKAASTGDEVHVCTVCGYLYETRTGEPFLRIRPGTRFEELDPATFRCPSCKSGKERFQPTTRVMSGPRGSERYGLGANELTPAQKNTLIFGALFLGFLLLMSGYLFN